MDAKDIRRVMSPFCCARGRFAMDWYIISSVPFRIIIHSCLLSSNLFVNVGERFAAFLRVLLFLVRTLVSPEIPQSITPNYLSFRY